MNSHSLVDSEPLLPRIFRSPSQEEKVFPCQALPFGKSSHESVDVQKTNKKKKLFFFNFERSIFHSSFSQCSKENGGFMFKKKEQTCGKRLGLESCFLKFEVKGSDGQVKYVLWDYIAVTAICNEKLIFCRSFLKYITNSESVKKIHGFCFFYSLFKSTELI